METIDDTVRTMGFKVFDFPFDRIIPTVYLVGSLNRIIFSLTGMEAFGPN